MIVGFRHKGLEILYCRSWSTIRTITEGQHHDAKPSSSRRTPEIGNEAKAFGVVVPDLPGCFSAGDTWDEALDAAKEAIAAWVDAAFDSGMAVPAPSSLDAVRRLPDYEGWTAGLVEVRPTMQLPNG